MTPLLHPFLVNDEFGDPGVYVDFKFDRRGLLFDLGDLHGLHPRRILRLSDIFVSHLHVDHFIGFDQVLRTLIGHDKEVRLYGPTGFIGAVERRLASYAWNLAERYKNDLTFSVLEVHSPRAASCATFRMRNRFGRESGGERPLQRGLIFNDGRLRATACVLDHGIPCLAYAVEESAHINIWKSRLLEMGLPVGPWLRELKRAVLRGDPDETEIPVWSKRDDGAPPLTVPLGRLKRKALGVIPGQKIAYVVDAAFTEQNAERIIALVRDADTLFIEASFARDDTARAAERRHLTTAQAGFLARQARVRRMVPFHFSPRYKGEAGRLRREAEDAFAAR